MGRGSSSRNTAWCRDNHVPRRRRPSASPPVQAKHEIEDLPRVLASHQQDDRGDKCQDPDQARPCPVCVSLVVAGGTAHAHGMSHATGTPAAELADPVRYCRLTAQLLHRSGLEYIASPGFDLAGSRPANGEWFRRFVRAGLMKCGRYADYLDIQDQLMQGTSTYARDAQAAATLLHQINPRAKLLMGLSTSPSGRLSTAGQLWQAYKDTSRFVNGYWLNVPHNVSGHSVPSVAIQFLQKVVTKTR